MSIVQTSDNTEGCTGTIVWIATYKDCNDATYFWTYTYTVLTPVVEMPVNLSMEVACPGLAVQLNAPEVSDNCERLLLFIGTATTNTYNGCEGSVTYVYNYQDCAGNNYSWTLSYDILPLTGPVLVDEEVDCSSLDQYGLPYDLEEALSFDPNNLNSQVASLYTDNCGGNVSATFSSLSYYGGGIASHWSIAYEFIISDLCGNTTTCIVHYSGGYVPENVTISQGLIRVNEVICYGATNSITVSGLQVRVSLTLIAGNSIHLLPGFRIYNEGHFHGYISNNYCVNPITIPSSKEEPAVVSEELVSESFNDKFFRVYPNPTTGTFILETSGIEESSKIVAGLYNMMGEQLMETELFGFNQYEFNISSLPRGIYIVRVLHGERFDVERIIKQ